VTHEIIIVAFPIIEPLKWWNKRFTFLRSNAVSGSMKYFKNKLFKN